MTKRQVIDLATNQTGLWFLWQSATSAIAIGWMSALLQASAESELMPKSSGFLLVQAVLLFGVYSALGLYCLRADSALFNLLNREEPENGDLDTSSTTSSTLGLEPGLTRNGQTFFVKMSYFRRGL